MKNLGKCYYELFFTLGMICSAVISIDRIYDFLNMFMKGMFTSLTLVFLLTACYVRLNKKLQKKMEVERGDERIAQITGKSAAITITVMTVLLIVATIVLGFFGEPYTYISIILTAVMFLQVMMLWIVRAILSQKM